MRPCVSHLYHGDDVPIFIEEGYFHKKIAVKTSRHGWMVLRCTEGSVNVPAEFGASQPVQIFFDSTTQVPSCLAADIPDDCPQRFAGPGAPDHSGMFEVANKPIVLHVHPDVQNAMS